MIIGRQSGLGRGLGALIPPNRASGPSSSGASSTGATSDTASVHSSDVRGDVNLADQGPRELEIREPGKHVLEIPIQDIERNPHQPRIHFDHTQLEDLISSIKEHGIIQPLVVTELENGKYQLIAGERRLRAALIAGLQTVPAVVR
ncbi:MAG TPA: ParB/RepB/Spo0J family partition protein, partial [Patescibacteria group bacterium]|nr:ParB/RepB/Spo0J family partition protein [Patescibacteria group bacterium]